LFSSSPKNKCWLTPHPLSLSTQAHISLPSLHSHHKLYAAPAEPLFKMARFKNVPSRVAGPYRGLSMTRSLDRSLLAVERAENDMLAHTATGVVEDAAVPETMQQGEAVPQ